MAGMGSGYDLSVSTISPDGRVFQVEYASKSVDNSGTALGMVCTDGIVLGVEKFRDNEMLVEGTNRRLMAVDTHIGIAISGMLPDARQIVKRAAEEATSYKDNYGIPIPAKILAERIGLYVHTFTLYWSVRPFGAAVLIASVDSTQQPPKGELYCVEPSGTSYKYLGMAIGRWKLSAKTHLETIDFSKLTCEEGILEVCSILRQVQDKDKDNKMEIEISAISPQTNMIYKMLDRETVKKVDQQAQEKIALQENMDMENE